MTKVRTREEVTRTLVTAAVRRARCAEGLTQAELGDAIGLTDRSVRRAESGRIDFGLLEAALRHPPFARTLFLELLKISQREVSLVRLADGPSGTGSVQSGRSDGGSIPPAGAGLRRAA